MMDSSVILTGFTILVGAVLVLAERRDWLLFALLADYLLLTLATRDPLGLQVALIKLLGGSLVVAVLWISVRGVPQFQGGQGVVLLTRTSFRVVALLIVLTAGWGSARAEWLQVPSLGGQDVLTATLMLAVGLLQLALFQRPFRVGLGWLTVLAGFEIFYSAIEPSLALVSLLVAVHLGLALVTGYLTGQWHAANMGEAGTR